MHIDIVTIFPQIFPPVMGEGMIRIAQEGGLVELKYHDLRDYTTDKHRSVDDRPFGGGPGMVMMCGPIFRAVEAIEAQSPIPAKRLLLTPQGRPLKQALVRELAKEQRLLIICGRYEGFDERIRIGLQPLEISIGDYVLSGGEIPAMVIVDAIVRLIPGVTGHPESPVKESFSEEGLLEYPQYTRPVEFRRMRVPEILRSGDHAKIAEWQEEQARLRTAQRRPDLLSRMEEEKSHKA
jgi:tRNA (guanine37-N1)-methyltransferase